MELVSSDCPGTKNPLHLEIFNQLHTREKVVKVDNVVLVWGRGSLGEFIGMCVRACMLEGWCACVHTCMNV